MVHVDVNYIDLLHDSSQAHAGSPHNSLHYPLVIINITFVTQHQRMWNIVVKIICLKIAE